MPYKSKAQAAYFNIHKKELEKEGVNVDEWNAASKGKKLPKHAKMETESSQYDWRKHMGRPKKGTWAR